MRFLLVTGQCGQHRCSLQQTPRPSAVGTHLDAAADGVRCSTGFSLGLGRLGLDPGGPVVGPGGRAAGPGGRAAGPGPLAGQNEKIKILG